MGSTLRELYPNADGIIGGELENMTRERAFELIKLDVGFSKIRGHIFEEFLAGNITYDCRTRLYGVLEDYRRVFKDGDDNADDVISRADEYITNELIA